MDKDSIPSFQRTIAEVRRPRRSQSAPPPSPENPEAEAPVQPKLSQEEIEKLVADNVNLAYWFANQWRNIPGVDKEDIESQAIHGLVKAANTFDPAKGNFAGYASQVIRNYLGHLHHHQGEKTAMEPTSLDAPIGAGGEEDDDGSMHDKYGDPRVKGTELTAARSEAAKIVDEEVNSLPEPERSMVQRYMSGASYRDMQSEFKLSFMQIRNRVVAALSTIRARLAAKGIIGLEDIWPESMADDTDGKMIYECLLAQVEISLAVNSLQEKETVAEVRRFTTKAQDAAFLSKALAGAQHEWKVGDTAKAYRGGGTAKVSKIEGDIIHLDNGESMHKSNMRLPD